MQLNFYFKINKKGLIEKELNTKISTPAYNKISFEVDNMPTTEQYEKAKKALKKSIAIQFDIEEKYISAISESEYLANTEETSI